MYFRQNHTTSDFNIHDLFAYLCKASAKSLDREVPGRQNAYFHFGRHDSFYFTADKSFSIKCKQYKNSNSSFSGHLARRDVKTYDVQHIRQYLFPPVKLEWHFILAATLNNPNPNTKTNMKNWHEKLTWKTNFNLWKILTLELRLHAAINRADFVFWWMWFNSSPAFCFLRNRPDYNNNNLFSIPTSPKCFSVGFCKYYVQYSNNIIQCNTIRYAIRLIVYKEEMKWKLSFLQSPRFAKSNK